MDLQLRGRVAVITGAGAGIGLSVVEQFLAAGARVVGADLDPTALKGLSGEVLPVTADLTEQDSGELVIDAAITEFGAIDVLVNNVGTYPWRDSFVSVSDADWMHVLNINLLSAVRMTRATIPHMVAAGRGSMVHIASEAGRQPAPFFVDYCAAKAGMLSMSKSLSVEFGPHGIRSNVVSPGPTRTAGWDMPGGLTEVLAGQFDMEPEAALEFFVKEVRKLPTGRLGRPDEVAGIVAFLASDLAAQVTGAEYTVNGGSYHFA